MKRREILKGASLLAASATIAACSPKGGEEGNAGEAPGAPAVVRKRRTLKLVTTWPKNLPGIGEGPERIASAVAAMTDGALTLKVYAADELMPALGVFDAVSNGDAEMYHGAEYYWQGKSKAYSFFTAVPFGLNVAEHNAWILHGGGQALWDELAAKFNIKPILAGNTGVQMGGWFNREIKTVEDLKGLKIRMPGLGGEVLRRLGASAVLLAGGDIFPALQNGTIDAAEWAGPFNDMALGFHQVAKYYYYPGWQEPSAALALAININVWNSFTDAERAIIKSACLAEDDTMFAQYNHDSTAALKQLVTQHGIQLRQYPDAVLKEIARVSGEVVQEISTTDDLTHRIYESFLEARRSGIAWGEVGEAAYWRAREVTKDLK